MSRPVTTTLLLLLCCWRSLSLDQTCSGPLCHVTLDHPDYFAIKNDTMIVVGLKDEIIQLTLDFRLIQSVQSFDNQLSLSCRRDTSNEATDCHNYYRSIMFPSGNLTISGSITPDETFIACSTNYFHPVCEYRLISDLSLVRIQTSTGFCPEQADVSIAFVEFDTTVWAGSSILRDARNGLLVQSEQPFNGFINLATINDSNYWLKASSFVDMYEKGDYVYTFFREITVELDPNAVRSRVARICKRDSGSHISGQQTFQTFIKSSIRCVVQGTGSSDERYNFPYYFDHLYDTTLLQSGSYNQLSTVRSMQLYGVFQNSGNGPVGSVVCVYTLDHMSNDVTRVFRGDYLRRITSNGTWQRVSNPIPFTCDNGRSVQDAENDIITYNDVEQANPASYPLYLKNGQKFHKIAVGQVRGLDDIMYEVMFIAAEDEEGNYFITKVSYVEGRGEQRSMEHDVLMLDQSDHRVNHMQYHEQDDGEDMLYISTPNRLYQMNPFYCADHLTCTTCVASMDPYCVYDTIQGACVGINSANRNAALQNVTGGVANCPVVNTSSATPTTMPPTTDTTDTTDTITIEYINQGGALRWAGIGTVIGICLTFVVGIFLMFACHGGLRLVCKVLNNEKSTWSEETDDGVKHPDRQPTTNFT